MIPIAILTMVYDDDVYLDIWLTYWTRFVPRENLYVLIHADYEKYERIAAGCNTLRINRPQIHSNFESDRWEMLSQIASGLTHMFQKVIYTDVDEIIALDPKAGDDPIAYILSLPDAITAPFGLDVVDPSELTLEAFDPTRRVLEQRPFVASSTPYSKPCIISAPIRWSQGGHFCDVEQVSLSPSLYLFHLRLFDSSVYRARSKERRAMVGDTKTGEPIEGLGGPSWRRTDELRKYSISSPKPLDDLLFEHDRDMWINKVNITEDGFYERKGRLRKDLYHLPDRFLNVF